MACSPSLSHYYKYHHHHHHRCASLTSRIDQGTGVAGGGHASRSPSSSSARFGAHLNLKPSSSDFSGLSIIGSDLRFRLQMMSTTHGSSTTSKDISNSIQPPDHLLVLVHGIMASPSDWTYADAELKRQLPSNFLIYACSSNSYTKTFSGIDGAGRRLADEVLNVVERTESLKRISFLAHSLGGLFARYAIAILYCSDTGTIAGLEPINFITLATPHLGVRGKKQLPFLLGVPILEKLAPPLAPILIGRTGRQLFLRDGKPSKAPLLLRMASDYEDKKFISSLAAFKSRILYANVSYDHMVGWRTSSIRRESELGKPPLQSLDGYKHVVDVQYCPPVPSEGPHFPPEAAKAKEAAQTSPNMQHTAEYHVIMEEEMIRGLQRVGWKKVDVSFHSAFWPFFAHNNIHVKSEWLHNAGAGVIAHVADSLKQQESRQNKERTIDREKAKQVYDRDDAFVNTTQNPPQKRQKTQKGDESDRAIRLRHVPELIRAHKSFRVPIVTYPTIPPSGQYRINDPLVNAYNKQFEELKKYYKKVKLYALEGEGSVVNGEETKS